MDKQKIIQMLKEIIGKSPQVFHIATVKEIDGNTCTITPLDEDMPQEIDGVRLKSFSDGQYGILITPKKDSFVIVMQINDIDYAVTHYDEIDSISISINDKNSVSIQDKKISIAVDQTTTTITDSKIEINADEIVFNGGDNKGLVKIEKMVDWMSKVYQDLQTLKSTLANISTVSTIIAPAGVAGGPCSGVLSINFNPNVPNPQVSTFENDKIKH